MTEDPLYDRVIVTYLNGEGVTDEATIEVNGGIQEVILIKMGEPKPDYVYGQHDALKTVWAQETKKSRTKIVTDYKIPQHPDDEALAPFWGGEVTLKWPYATNAKKLVMFSHTKTPVQAEVVITDEKIQIVILPYTGEVKQ